MTRPTARRVRAGNVPGRPRQISQTRVFGSSGAPSAGAVAQSQNIFDSVRSCAWTSMPMTVSYSIRVVTAMRPIVPREALCSAPMKIGEWDELGRARALLQRQIGELKADESAAHVSVNPDTGRLHVMVATNVGLLDYHYGPAGAPEGPWTLRGQLHRWPPVRGLRLQPDAPLAA